MKSFNVTYDIRLHGGLETKPGDPDLCSGVAAAQDAE